MQEIELENKALPYEIAEEIKQLRSNILFCGDDKRTIMVTSCVSGEGKTMTSLLIAKSFADTGRAVLLIDGDMRRSTLKNQITKGRVEIGLSHLLSGQCQVEDVICNVKDSMLSIIPSGKTPPNPVELLLSQNFNKVLEHARSIYDYIIIDCPPLGMVSDAAAVAPCCDGALMLISAGIVSYKFAQKVKEQLEKSGCPILGVVLNKVDYKSEGTYGRYGKYYGKYYGRYYGKYYGRYE